MATILKFEPRQRDRSETGAQCSLVGGTARGEVVIFPGVRLERHAFNLSDQLPDPDPGKPGIKRGHRTTGN